MQFLYFKAKSFPLPPANAERTSMAQVLSTPSHSLKEFRILPGYTPTDGSAPNASLKTRLCRKGDGFLYLHVPFLSAAMQAVTGSEMAIALAQLGGIGILPVSQPTDEQCAKVGQVKRFKAGFQTDILTLAPEQPIAEVVEIIRRTGYTTFPGHHQRPVPRPTPRHPHRQGLRRAPRPRLPSRLSHENRRAGRPRNKRPQGR